MIELESALGKDGAAITRDFLAQRLFIEQIAEKLDFKTLAIVPDLSVQDGIQATRRMLQIACFDEEKCKKGLEALRQYELAGVVHFIVGHNRQFNHP